MKKITLKDTFPKTRDLCLEFWIQNNIFVAVLDLGGLRGTLKNSPVVCIQKQWLLEPINNA